MFRSSAFVLVFAACLPAQGGSLKQAEVTRIVNDVKVVNQAPRPAVIGDTIQGQTAVTTGTKSRAELKFSDQTLTRLGSNTMFRLNEGVRDLRLEEGVILLQVPKKLGSTKVHTAAVTAAVTGTTILIEFQPNGTIKIIVLEGELNIYMNDSPGEFLTLRPGDMIVTTADATSLPTPVQVDLERLLATSGLINDPAFGPLGNLTQLADAVTRQNELKNEGQLLQTQYVIPGSAVSGILTNDVNRNVFRTVLENISTQPQGNGNGFGGGEGGGQGPET